MRPRPHYRTLGGGGSTLAPGAGESQPTLLGPAPAHDFESGGMPGGLLTPLADDTGPPGLPDEKIIYFYFLFCPPAVVFGD